MQIKKGPSSNSDLDHDFSVSIVGTKNEITRVAQQLVWLCNIFRIPNSDGLSLSRTEFMWLEEGNFVIQPKSSEIVSESDNYCWHTLLGNAVIADDFPIPAREAQIGLELPFFCLLQLSRVYAEIQFGDHVALYGSSSLLYPTSISTEKHTQPSTEPCIQWHLISGEHPHLSADALAEDQGWIRIDDKTSLPTTRCIVGYCRNTSILLGTERFRYDETKSSEMPDNGSTPGVKIKSIEIGTSGAGIFGIQIGMDVLYPKSLEVSPELTKYDDILDTTRTMSMVLYDSGERRGWLVPAQTLLLHMAQCWIKKNTPGVNLEYANPEYDGGNPIQQLLTKNYKLLLKHLLDDDSEWFLRDLIKQLWRDLQGCMIARKQSRSDDQGLRTLSSTSLLAWEFLDFIERPSAFHIRKCPLDFAGCGWNALAEDNEMMILVCRGLGNVIIPTNDANLCSRWSTVPSNRAYLTASISCMRVLSQTAIGGLCMGLTRRVFWRPTEQNLLEDCVHRAQNDCHKTLQKVITKIDPAPLQATAFPPSGAVIFGVRKLQKCSKPGTLLRSLPIRRADDRRNEDENIEHKSK